MRDLLNSTLPRHFLSELDEKYGIIDVSPLFEASDYAADAFLVTAEAEIKLQNKFAKQHADGHLGRREAYLAMCLEITEMNDWRSEDRHLRLCCWKTFLKRVDAHEARAASGAFPDDSWSHAA